MGSDCSSLPHFFCMLPIPSEETKLSYDNKTQTSQRLIFYSHKICWRSRHLSESYCLPCVGGVTVNLISLNIAKTLYFMFTIFMRRQQNDTIPSFCFSTFFYLTAPPRQSVLPQTLRQWKRKHGEQCNSSSVPSHRSSGVLLLLNQGLLLAKPILTSGRQEGCL